MNRYSEAVEQHFRAPRHAAVNAGPVAQPVRTGRADTPGSSAVVELQLVLVDERIEKARFLAHGCPSCIAAADWACEWLTGKNRADALQLSAARIEAALELVASKRHCGLLVEDALQAALSPAQ